jgi:Histidine phosphatase superfamily (branch 1)
VTTCTWICLILMKGTGKRTPFRPQTLLLLSSRRLSSFASMARNMERRIVRVYIVRHGETDENRAGVMQGQLDTRLNEAGLVQAGKTGFRLKDAELGIAFASDLTRAVKARFLRARYIDIA